MGRDRFSLGNKNLEILQYLQPQKRLQVDNVAKMFKHFGEVFGLEQSKLDKLMEEVCLYTSSITPPKFNKDTDSLDSWFDEVIKLMNEIEKVDVFDNIVKKILTIPHGQAFVERGFNISKRIATGREKICEETFRFEKVIVDKLHHAGSVKSILFKKPLLSLCHGAQTELKKKLREEKDAAEKEEMNRNKRKVEEDLIKEKKKKIEDWGLKIELLKKEKEEIRVEKEIEDQNMEDFLNKSMGSGISKPAAAVYINKAKECKAKSKELYTKLEILNEKLCQLSSQKPKERDLAYKKNAIVLKSIKVSQRRLELHFLILNF